MNHNQSETNRKPNVIIILADDMGYSDLGCYGGFAETPNLDRLAYNGIRLTEFYNTARCSPSRASLLTGLHPHQAGMAHLQGRYGPYTKQLNQNCVTIAEVLKENGYGTYMSGKWHAGVIPPHERGFDKAYVYPGGDFFKQEGIALNGEKLPVGSDPDYYSTDDMTDKAVSLIEQHTRQKPDQPFFLYMAYTAPHFPLQAKEEDIKKYKGRFDEGWDVLRGQKYERMKRMGLIKPGCELSPADTSAAEPWENEPHKEWRLRAMEVYAAMIDCMDQNVGKLLATVENSGQQEHTLIIFLSDNGGNGEFPVIKDPSLLPGGPEYYARNGHYGYGWANLSNTPFRMYKHYIHEGGIASPFIVHWPERLKSKGAILGTPVQLPDIMATVVDATGAVYPETYHDFPIMPMEGVSMLPIFEGGEFSKELLFWEHEGNCGVRRGSWKLVKFFSKPWELYNLETDGSELHDVSGQYPEIAQALGEEYVQWTHRANVYPREHYQLYDKRNVQNEQVVDLTKVKRPG